MRDLYDFDVRDQRRLDPTLQDTDDSLIDRDGLVNLITYAIDGASWDYSGGPGSIAAFGGSAGRLTDRRQTRTHRSFPGPAEADPAAA